MILEQNLFVEYLLPLRGIPAEAIDVYRSHWRIPGEARRPMLSWTRDLPIAGEPADVVAVVEDYARFLSTSPIPKMFIDAEPGGFLIGAQREFCRAWPNQEQVIIKGAHFLQEEAPDEVGEAIARFIAKVLAGGYREEAA
jgi:haloalkane dehalogenase